jgi:hypothetical protein
MSIYSKKATLLLYVVLSPFFFFFFFNLSSYSFSFTLVLSMRGGSAALTVQPQYLWFGF